MAELIFNGFLLVFCIIMFISAGQIVIWNDEIWARYWPMMLLGIAVVIFAVKVYQIVKSMSKEDWNFNLVEVFGLKDKMVQKLLLSFAWLIFYAAIMETAGFVISTIIFCIGMQMFLQLKFSVKAVIYALLITAVMYVIFVWGLGTSVPRGTGPIYDFGMALEYLWS